MIQAKGVLFFHMFFQPGKKRAVQMINPAAVNALHMIPPARRRRSGKIDKTGALPLPSSVTHHLAVTLHLIQTAVNRGFADLHALFMQGVGNFLCGDMLSRMIS